jgi:hypothetical protein
MSVTTATVLTAYGTSLAGCVGAIIRFRADRGSRIAVRISRHRWQ